MICQGKDDFFSSIKLRITDVLIINFALLVCLATYTLIYILARAAGYEQITVEKFRDIIFVVLWGVVIFIIYKYKLNNIDFIGLGQLNIIKSIQYGLLITLILLCIKTLFGLISAKGIVDLIEKGQPTDHTNSLLLFFAKGIVPVIIGPILEEIIFRGFIYPPLRIRYGVLLGIVISSFIFSIWHMGASLIGIINIFIVGVLLAYVYEISKTLIPSIISHIVLNLNLQLYLIYDLLMSKNIITMPERNYKLIILSCYIVSILVLYIFYRRRPKHCY